MRAFLLASVLLAAFLIPLQAPQPLQMDEGVSVNPTSHGASITVTPTSGWTTGGEEITITGSGFLDMAFQNVTNDGEPYTWTTNTINYVTGAGYSPSVVVDSNGTIHIVHVIWSDEWTKWHG